MLLPWLLLLTLPAVARAQFNYTTNSGAITITGYAGSGGWVIIPSEINNLPVSGIGASAFQDCGSLTNITIPNSVTSIGAWAFSYCSSLSAITVDALNSSYSSVAGVLFDKSRTALIAYPGGRAGSYTIPNGVTSIGDYAFLYCTSLTSVTIPNSVTNIGDDAFLYCTSVTNVAIGSSVTSIGRWAFGVCSSLSGVTIPSSVTSIANGAFDSCSSLTAITVDADNSAYSSVDGVLFNQGQATLIAYPGGKAGGYTIPSGVTGIGDGAFGYCGSLGSVRIPNSVTNIGDDAFYGCTGLIGVTIPNSVSRIGDGAFDSCSSLTAITVEAGNSVYSSVDGVLFNQGQTALIACPGGISGGYTIPSGVTGIGDYAFFSCTTLTGVTIGNSVTNIGYGAFDGCSSLTNVRIPSSVVSIGDYAFDDCTSLAEVYFQGNSPSADSSVFDGENSATVYYMPGTTGWGPTFAGRPTVLNPAAQFTFANNSGAITITGYTGPGGAVTIPSTINGLAVTSVGNSAFYGGSLTSVTVGSGVSSIGDYAFGGCASLTAITVDALNSSYSSAAGVLFDKSQTALIQCPGGKAGSYMIPNGVTSIGHGAFAGCTSLTGITIPNSVTNIGDLAFDGCTGLTGITVDALNSSYSSVAGVLFDKGQATLIQCPGGKAGSYMIPNSVTSIGHDAFSVCTSLANVTIPNSVTSIGHDAFSVCTSLTGITIPGSVTSVGDEAFEWCSSLASVTIGDNVASVGAYAFSSCTSLTSVYFQGNAPSADSTVFAYDNSPTVYYLPGTTGWSTTFGGRPTALWKSDLSLHVTLSPPRAVSAGAQWQVDGGAWQSSGATVSNLWAGARTVSFKPISGWETPADQTVTVTNGATTKATGVYTLEVKGNPQLTILSLKSGQGVSNALLLVTGTVSDKATVDEVYY